MAPWIALILAGLLEVCWAVGLKYTDGFRQLLPSLVVVFALVASLYLLAFSVRYIPLGTAYAIWVGIGALGTACAGVVLFGEALAPLRLLCLLLLMAAIVGLKLTA